MLFHGEDLHGDNYLVVCGPFANGFSEGCSTVADLEHDNTADVPYTVGNPGLYTFSVFHAKGATHGNIGGYLQCQVELEVTSS